MKELMKKVEEAVDQYYKQNPESNRQHSFLLLMRDEQADKEMTLGSMEVESMVNIIVDNMVNDETMRDIIRLSNEVYSVACSNVTPPNEIN